MAAASGRRPQHAPGERAGELLDIGIVFDDVGAAEKARRHEGVIGLAGAKPVLGEQFWIVDNRDGSGFGGAAGVARQSVFLQANIGRLDPADTAGADQEIKIIAVHSADHIEVAPPCPSQLPNEGHRMLIHRDPRPVRHQADRLAEAPPSTRAPNRHYLP